MKRGTIKFWSKFAREANWDLKAVVIVHDVEELNVLDVIERIRARSTANANKGFRRFVANCGGVIAAKVVRELDDAFVCLDMDSNERTDYEVDVYSTLSTEAIEWKIVKNGLEMNGHTPILRLA